jgi:accessory gene regulator B
MYGLQTMIEKFVNICTIIIFAIVSKEVLVSFVFYLCFVYLRKYTGGFHARTFLKCYFLSSISFAVAVLLIKYNVFSTIIYRILCVLGIVLLLKWKPIDSENKPISDEEKNLYYKKVIMLLLIFCILCVGLWMFEIYELEKAIESVVILVAGTSCICKIKSADKGDNDSDEIKIMLEDIVYMISKGKKVEIYTTKNEYVTYEKLDILEERIKKMDNNFIRIDKSYLVNFQYVVEYGYSNIKLDNKELVISRGRREEVKYAYMRLKGIRVKQYQ